MSFKDGIPLLTSFNNAESSEEDEDDFTVATLPFPNKKFRKKHVVFSAVLVLALFLVLALLAGVIVPVVLIRQDSQGGGLTQTAVAYSSPVASSSIGSTVTVSSSPVASPPAGLSHTTLSSTPIPLPSSSRLVTSSPLTPSLQISSTRTVPVSPASSPMQTPTVSMSPTPSPGVQNFFKSKFDDRDYRLVTLNNSLRVLLISAPNSNISAATMDVATGSFNDPQNLQGLAHFCEHMLFLGTDKYPDEGNYSQYLTQHGGYDNAFTSSQHTNYYFTVQSDYLPGALDRFAQFFISPLFNGSSVDKEKNAVNAEHEKNLLSDSWRLWQLTKEVSNPAHPFHKFATGSLATLDNPDLLQSLKDFYKSFYSANTVSVWRGGGRMCVEGWERVCVEE